MLSANKNNPRNTKEESLVLLLVLFLPSLSAGTGPPLDHFKVIDAFSLDSCVTLSQRRECARLRRRTGY